MNSGQEIPGELVVSGGDATEVLEPAEAAFDDISAFVGALVEVMDDNTVGFVRDDGLCAATNDFAAKVVAVIPFVGEERAHGRRERQNIGRCSDVRILGSDAGRPAGRADRSAHDFCRAAPARAADCLIVLPPFPPEAHR